MITIEKDVPLPELHEKHLGKWAKLIRNMNVGDSFLFSLDKRANVQQSVCQYKLRSAMGKDTKFTIRKVSDTEARCWRLK